VHVPSPHWPDWRKLAHDSVGGELFSACPVSGFEYNNMGLVWRILAITVQVGA
jgi:hypothetical protein